MGLTVTELAPGLSLHQRREDEPQATFFYELDNSTLKVCELEYDFSASSNMAIQGTDSMVIQVSVQPFERKAVAVVQVVDKYQGWSLSTSWRYSLTVPPREVLEEYVSKDRRAMEAEQELFREALSALPTDILPVDMIQHLCKRRGLKFFDLDFPADSSSLFPHPNEASDQVVQWRRPGEFMLVDPEKNLGNPDVFIEGIEPGDIRQGALGDCWLMCALSSLAEFPDLVRKLFVTTSANEEGVYRVVLCKNGEWVNVTVDDLFPCFPGSGPIYSRSRGNELWVLLLEKAFAKIHGCYGLLRGGWANEGMIDLTGCPGTRYDFSAEDIQEKIHNGDLFALMKEFDERQYLLSASTPGEDRWSDVGGAPVAGEAGCTGLVHGHAYTVLQVKESRTGARLLNLRNPWGNFEWNGDWSDSSPLWTESIKQELNFVPDAEDGAFWMSFEDFVTHFACINVNRTQPWRDIRQKGLFIRSDGFTTSNCLFELEVATATRLFVGLHQEDSRVDGVSELRPYIDLGAIIYKEDDGMIEIVDSVPQSLTRESQAEFVLDPGSYYILPCSTGCRMQPEEGDSQEEHPLLDGDHLDIDFLWVLKDIFRKYDVTMQQRLDFQEFSRLVADVGEPPLDQQTWNHLITDYCGNEHGIPFRAVEAYFTRDHTADIRKMLSLLGYSKSLWSGKSRCFVLSVHSEADVVVKRVDLRTPDISEKVQAHFLKSTSEPHDPSASVCIYSKYQSGAYTYSYAVENQSAAPISFTLDSSNSAGLLCSSEQFVCTRPIEPNEIVLMQHLQCQRSATSFSTSWKASWTT